MSAEPGEDVVDSGGGAVEGPGDLPVGHASDRELQNHGCEFGSFLPVGYFEGLSRERFTAVQALESLDLVGWFVSLVVSGAPELPSFGRVVEGAFWIGAVGWLPLPGVLLLSIHTRDPGNCWTQYILRGRTDVTVRCLDPGGEHGPSARTHRLPDRGNHRDALPARRTGSNRRHFGIYRAPARGTA